MEGKVERDLSTQLGVGAEGASSPQVKLIPSQRSHPKQGDSFVAIYGDAKYHLYYENSEGPNSTACLDEETKIETHEPWGGEVSVARWLQYTSPEDCHSPQSTYRHGKSTVKIMLQHAPTPETSHSSTPPRSPPLASIPEISEWPDYFMLGDLKRRLQHLSTRNAYVPKENVAIRI